MRCDVHRCCEKKYRIRSMQSTATTVCPVCHMPISVQNVNNVNRQGNDDPQGPVGTATRSGAVCTPRQSHASGRSSSSSAKSSLTLQAACALQSTSGELLRALRNEP